MSFGWVWLHRKIKDWEWYKDEKVSRVFIHLLISANHKDGSWQGKEVKKGQVITGRKSLAYELGLSERNIRTALNKLKSTNEIAIETTTKYSIITISNFCRYNEIDQQDDQQVTNKRPTSDQQTTTNNNDNNDNKYKEEAKIFLNEFNSLWGTKYVSHRAWFKNFTKWREDYTLEQILDAMKNAKNHPFYKDKLNPDMLLRSHEDRIGQLLNFGGKEDKWNLPK